MSRDFLTPKPPTRTERATGDVRTQLTLLDTLARQGEGIDKRAAEVVRRFRQELGALIDVEQRKLDALTDERSLVITAIGKPYVTIPANFHGTIVDTHA